MPKIGAEPIRKAALIKAAIRSVGRSGSLDVTVAQIAREAGMSSALAHHYFGSKTRIFLAAMRQILTDYRTAVVSGIRAAETPQQGLDAIIAASFAGPNFDRDTVAAWLNFYALALVEPEAARLLHIYRHRLRSNLLSVLRPLAPARAESLAETLGALIDGVYLRAALSSRMSHEAAESTIRDYLKDALT